MLSLYDFCELGVNTASEIMVLRIECTKYGSAKPVKSRTHGNNAKFEIPKEILECLLDEDFLTSEIATMFSVSALTVYHRMKSCGLNKLDFSKISDQKLDNNVNQRVNDFLFVGKA